ncbi:hypothetical protein Mal4_15120 [Maioricimonas rarisocia]|uniref:Uncharacterized protein n=1 Tax=Maioricimonas rarisocia TaxID=2528026 RepID=A0A517Z3Y5_9PLAN|nr:hypothetical protein [Maioricimonas rarisocia]QDU37203.1 hypothetical protein Mal4_15120 [Maioricimonas rarisocia]
MEFSLPEIHEISVDVDGRQFDGSWYVVLQDMIVNYNGFTASTNGCPSNADEVAKGMLRQLVAAHYVRPESIPAGLPPSVREAAHRYINESLEESQAASFVASFGKAERGALLHRQLSWMCVNALAMIVPAWKYMCDGNAAEETYLDLRQWLGDPSHPVDWKSATTPAVATRDGLRVGDCDACRLEPIASAVAHTARYLQSADPADATESLESADEAYDEGCHSRGAPDRFSKWLVFDVLPRALACRPIEALG